MWERSRRWEFERKKNGRRWKQEKDNDDEEKGVGRRK